MALKKLLYDSNRSEIDQYFEDQASFLFQKQRMDRIDNFNGYFDFSTAICLIEAYFTKIVYNTEHNRITKPGKSKHKLRDLYSIYIL